MSTGRLMDKQTVVGIYAEILLSKKKKKISDACYNRNKPLKRYAK